MNEITYPDGRPVDGYGPGFFRIGGEVHSGPVLVSNAGAARWGGLGDEAPLRALAGQVDVLFIGTGPEIAHIPAGLRAGLEQAGLGVETMASPAAARTFNVLLGEGRRVAAALLPV